MDRKEIITCGIFLFDKDNRFLIGHPTNSNNQVHKFWSIPKGWNEEGENYFTSAKRELMEETNIDIDLIAPDITHIETLTILSYKGYNPFVKGVSTKRIAPYVIKTTRDFSNDDIKCDSMVTHMGPPFPEIDDFKWVTIDEAYDLLHKTQIKCLAEAEEIIYNLH